MKLHKNREEFEQLITLTARSVGIPETAVRKDYYIVLLLDKLAESDYVNECVFKGGTSLSKCYPGSIDRFSEDIDITYFPKEEFSDKQYDRALKRIESVMAGDANIEKIGYERNDRNKSSFIWFEGEDKETTKVKLEIGSSVRPDPYELHEFKSYIQEYLEATGNNDTVEEYELHSVKVNTLCIERTFIYKVMSVKRHAICGTLPEKVRHIYDVTKLFGRDDIQAFLNDDDDLKTLLIKTKDTDSFYLEKRNISREYEPTGAYAFNEWRDKFDAAIKERYESLHKDLLYTDEKQNFDEAVDVFEKLTNIFRNIGE